MAPNSFKSQAARQRSSSISKTVPRGIAPALLTRISTSPQAAATACTPARVLRSAAMPDAATPCRPRRSAAALSRSACVRATSCTSQPSAASEWAIASPIPFDAPAISARLPRRLRSIVRLFLQRRAGELGDLTLPHGLALEIGLVFLRRIVGGRRHAELGHPRLERLGLHHRIHLTVEVL